MFDEGKEPQIEEEPQENLVSIEESAKLADQLLDKYRNQIFTSHPQSALAVV